MHDIIISNLSKSYGTKKKKVTVVKNLSPEESSGEEGEDITALAVTEGGELIMNSEEAGNEEN